MEAALEPEVRQTHRSLQAWMMDRAKRANIAAPQKDPDDDSDEDEEDEEVAEKKKKEAAEEAEAAAKADEKNWSLVGLACHDAKIGFKGNLSELNFTNWLWFHVIRPKLAETKSKLLDPDLESSGIVGVDDV